MKTRQNGCRSPVPVDSAVYEALARSRLYAFLASLFTEEPDLERAQKLRQMAAELGIPCPNGYSLDELKREYMTLFVVPNPRYVAPYESVFRDRWPLPAPILRGSNPGERGATIKGPVMGESTQQVRACYAQAGVLPEGDLPDHIGNELRVMSYLWAETAKSAGDPGVASAAALREQFRKNHLMEWIGLLREKIEENDRLGFYSAAIELAERILLGDEP